MCLPQHWTFSGINTIETSDQPTVSSDLSIISGDTNTTFVSIWSETSTPDTATGSRRPSDQSSVRTRDWRRHNEHNMENLPPQP